MRVRCRWVCVCVTMLAACPLVAAGTTTTKPVTIAVSTDRIAYAPGGQVRVDVTVTAGTVPVSARLVVTVEHDLADRHVILDRPITVAPGKRASATASWTSARRELWGCEAKAGLTAGGKRLAVGRRVFVVSGNLPKASANYAFTHPMAMGAPTEVNLNRTFDCFARYAVPIVELFSWAESPWGKILPDQEDWINGQCVFKMNLRTMDGVVEHAHRRGMIALAYAITWMNGVAGYRWAQAHPEDVRYTTADAKLPPMAEADLKAWEHAEANAKTVGYKELLKLTRWGAAVNASRDATVDRAIDQYIAVVKRFKFDGIRWDGHPCNWYHPIMDWWRRMGSGGKTRYTPGYDWQGNLLMPDDPDVENVRIIRRVRERFRRHVPGMVTGYNIQAWNAFQPDVPEVVSANMFPRAFSEFMPGSLVLDEKHYHIRADGTPTMHKTWSKTRKVLRRGNDLINRWAAYHYAGGMPNSGAGPFLLHAHSLSYSLGVRTFAVANHYGKYPPQYESFLTFAQRYARYLFHPSRLRFLHTGDNETGDRVKVTCARPVVYKPMCYYLATNRTFSMIVNLWNQPVSEKMNVKQCDAPPMATDARVTLRQPLGMRPDKARVFVLSPEWADWCRPVTVDHTQPTVEVAVPPFRYWAVAVLHYPLLPEGIDKPTHHWFLPVLE